jgi:hypothetical protein
MRAEHFLSRLDRLARIDVDLALDLYRDPALLRFVLGSVPLPEGAERVAISVDDPDHGPFLIVTRDGHFVTCLARGMGVGDLPVVTRGQLDTLAAKGGALRERMALATRLVGSPERACARLLRRVLVAADTVSREDFLAVSAWEPMLAPVFLDLYLAMSGELLTQGPLVRRLKGSGARVDEALHSYWNLLHAAGHLALLGTMGGDRDHFEALTDGISGSRSAFTFGLGGTGVRAFILKGAWAAGRMGKLVLPAYKKALVEDVALFELFDTIFALVAIGTRSSALKAEVAKALRAAPARAHTPEAQRLREVLGDAVAATTAFAAELLDMSAEDLLENRLVMGQHILEDEPADLPAEIRGELARTLPFLSLTDGVTDGGKVAVTLGLVASAARAAPEDFYLPRDLARALHRPWVPAFTYQVLEPMAKAEQRGRKPAVRSVAAGRNEPCPCGSGRKFKKCCATAAP